MGKRKTPPKPTRIDPEEYAAIYKAEQLAMINAMYAEHGKVVEEINGEYELRDMTDDEKHEQWFQSITFEERIDYLKREIRSLERQLYACEQNLQEQTRLTEQARRLATTYLGEL